ncbi:MAG: sigma-54-dependent transcriptional regulator [bacterium]
MKQPKQRVLIIDDDSSICGMLRKLFVRENWSVKTWNDPVDAIKWVRENRIDLVFLDVKMAQMDGMQVLERIKRIDRRIEVIMMTGFATIQAAVISIKKGAYDFITKPFDDLNKIVLLAREAIQKKQEHERESPPTPASAKSQTPERLLGHSLKIQNVRRLVDKIADLDSTVLITGKSGTGKELVAKSIHEKSRRRNKGFVALNTCALPNELIESTLFGYEKGAFTGAYKTSVGLFEEVRGGTVFLDEIGDTSPSFQAKLLRILQEKEFQRVGGTRTLKSGVRIIAATNKDLIDEVNHGKFREDLFYRLNVIHITLPPLIDMREDIPLLAQEFLQDLCRRHAKGSFSFAPEVVERLGQYSWPGNVRELKNAIEYAVGVCEGNVIRLHHLPEHLQSAEWPKLPYPRQKIDSLLYDTEKQLIQAALQSTNGNVTQAAKLSGLSRQNFYYRLKKFAQDPADFKN